MHKKVSSEEAAAYVVNTLEESNEETKILAQALAIISRRVFTGDFLTSPEATRDYLRLHFSQDTSEVFVAIFLTQRNEVISVDRMFNGTIDGASVHPREIVKAALKRNAAAVIFAHNHPSGSTEPSEADKAITNRLTGALALIDVRVLDHFIVAGTNVSSFAELRLI